MLLYVLQRAIVSDTSLLRSIYDWDADTTRCPLTMDLCEDYGDVFEIG